MIAAIISQSKLFIFYHVVFIHANQPHSNSNAQIRMKQTPHKMLDAKNVGAC
jgi:hypothetical protein